MRALRLIFWLVVPVLAPGCATQPAAFDYDASVDFGQYRRWAWLPRPEAQPSGDPRIDNALTRKRIESAIARNLAAKGYAPSDTEAADFRVGYVVTIEKRPGSTTVGSSIGFGRYGGGSGFGISIGGPARSLGDYEEGTLFIDVRDGNSDDLTWRGSSTSRLEQSATPEEAERKIDEIVGEILKNFPPRPGG